MLKTPIYIDVSSIISILKLFHTELILYSNDVLEISLGDDFYYTIKEAGEISNAIDKISLVRQRKVMLIQIVIMKQESLSYPQKYAKKYPQLL